METSTQCIKVAFLRKETKYDNLKDWMEDDNNVYVGRRGRIFIGGREDKKIFHYKDSPFANPYKLGDYTLKTSLRLFKQYLFEENLVEKLKELEGKCLGCFCDQNNDCHAKVLVEVLNLSKEFKDIDQLKIKILGDTYSSQNYENPNKKSNKIKRNKKQKK